MPPGRKIPTDPSANRKITRCVWVSALATNAVDTNAQVVSGNNARRLAWCFRLQFYFHCFFLYFFFALLCHRNLVAPTTAHFSLYDLISKKKTKNQKNKSQNTKKPTGSAKISDDHSFQLKSVSYKGGSGSICIVAVTWRLLAATNRVIGAGNYQRSLWGGSCT